MGEQAANEVTVTAGGLTVKKALDREQFDALAFIYTISSTRDESVRIRLVDQLPDGVSQDDVGFHPEYDANNWQLEDEQVIYTDEVPPDKEVVTVYGLRDKDELDPEVTEPTVELNVDSQREPQASEAGNDSERQFLSGNIEQETQAMPEREDSSMTDSPEADSATRDSATGSPSAARDPEGFLEAVLTELEADEGANEYQDRFRDALGIKTGSLEARIEHLQSQVLDLSAYTDSLEAFLDDSGTADQIQDTLADLEDALDDVEGRIEANASTVEDLEGQVQELTRDIETLQADIESLKRIQADVEELETFREQLSMAVTEALDSE